MCVWPVQGSRKRWVRVCFVGRLTIVNITIIIFLNDTIVISQTSNACLLLPLVLACDSGQLGPFFLHDNFNLRAFSEATPLATFPALFPSPSPFEDPPP
jgi:hypothetical protein